MQRELDSVDVPARILGVNAAGAESGNDLAVQGRDLPWLQDTPEENAWGDWRVRWRDVVILDRENRKVAVYNVTDHNLARPSAYDSLKAMLVGAATQQ